MKSSEILNKFVSFYEQRGHKLIPNVSLVPENDPTLLYVNSGMFPLVPYLDGTEHPQGKRLVNVQRALRFFEDLENVGKTIRHTTCFHMLGNWSLGDYFKKEQLNWVYEFLIQELKLDPNKLYASVFAGDENAPKDTEAILILQDVFKKYGIDAKVGERIFEYDKKENWWQRGDALGELGGPDSEIFYYIGKTGNGLGMNPAQNDDVFLEIGNSVFMQYQKTQSGWKELSQKNIDFGGGLERLALIKQNKTNIYETDNFWPIIEWLQNITKVDYYTNNQIQQIMNVVADHMRAAVLLTMDGVKPSNKDQGYILRRLIRRMVNAVMTITHEEVEISKLVSPTADMLNWIYPELLNKTKEIEIIFTNEETKFKKAISKASKQALKQLDNFNGDIKELAQIGFDLYQSSGYPTELFLETAKKQNILIDEGEFDKHYSKLFKQHQKKSRAGAEHKFKGGLADQKEQTIKYHTATHLLHWALRKTFGNTVEQKGSNITGERLRFDFSHNTKLSQNEIKTIQNMINQKVDEHLQVNKVTLKKEDALKSGAIHLFNETYGDTVTVYYIGETLESAISKEFCRGPHVNNTSEIGHIEIFKQKKIGENIIRLYLR